MQNIREVMYALQNNRSEDKAGEAGDESNTGSLKRMDAFDDYRI
jgi:hypothetical protein